MLDRERADNADVEDDLLTLVLNDCTVDDVDCPFSSSFTIEADVVVDSRASMLEGCTYPSEARRENDGMTWRVGLLLVLLLLLSPEERVGVDGEVGQAESDDDDSDDRKASFKSKERDLELECL